MIVNESFYNRVIFTPTVHTVHSCVRLSVCLPRGALYSISVVVQMCAKGSDLKPFHMGLCDRCISVYIYSFLKYMHERCSEFLFP